MLLVMMLRGIGRHWKALLTVTPVMPITAMLLLLSMAAMMPRAGLGGVCQIGQ